MKSAPAFAIAVVKLVSSSSAARAFQAIEYAVTPVSLYASAMGKTPLKASENR
jgi:hypothetical protein